MNRTNRNPCCFSFLRDFCFEILQDIAIRRKDIEYYKQKVLELHGKDYFDKCVELERILFENASV